MNFPPTLKTPAYVVDIAPLKANLATAARIKQEAGCKILLATKAFALPAVFPLMRAYLDGSTASGLYEARLGFEDFGKEVHVYSPAYATNEMAELLTLADHLYFNSPQQLTQFLPQVQAASPAKHVGVRLNAGYSSATLGGALYDPCAPCSRFGTTQQHLNELPWGDIDILHFHSLCEATHEGSVGLINHVATQFRDYIPRVKTINFGGGHLLNKAGYNVDALIAAIKDFRAQFGVEVILEPGAGLVVDAGYFVASVLDIHHNDKDIAILDGSASCHLPDVLEVPYTPPVFGTNAAHPHSYILAGATCMTGDIIGEYRFANPLQRGDTIVFGDMLHYTFVKNNTFNGTPLPDLALLHEDGRCEVVRSFSYQDFRGRLG
jgi:carboxynorspermidine decarboxylase